ncbi:MAG TPA: L-threonylcarbamoyladenylate synthase [Methylomirabilota bacterium]|nr:L-threonylcarbamoyladenylate synthase [Methylomirabilota bacterium]
MGTEVVAVDSEAPEPGVLSRAAGVLEAGGLVAFPTETFYGLGASALDADAVRRVFALKGRPESRPLLVLVDGVPAAERIAEVPPHARALMDRYWPGALTLVLRARPIVPDEVTAATGTVGVRVPAHAVARGLAHALGGPVTAPSANPTGAKAPTTAAEVRRYFDSRLPLVLDGGPTTGGLPSTVLDVTVDPPRLLRAGAVRVK